MADDTPQAQATGSSGKVVEAPRIFFVNKQAEQLLSSNAPPVEDRFSALLSADSDVIAPIAPPEDPLALRWLVEHNDILRPCIEAYVSNIPGTGWDLELADETREETDADKAQKARLEQFFDEPWPETSFTSESKKLIRDREETGNAYLEIVRNVKDKIQGVRRLDATDMRFLRLDDPVEVSKKIRRGGEIVSFVYPKRERRFVQAIGSTFVYYKEFGATRDLNKKTGRWADPGTRLPPEDRATEILHIGTGIQDTSSPYHLPRWYGNLPSVQGSREAESFNIEFFDSGGVPPLLLIVQGGRLAQNAEQALRDHFMTSGGARHSAAILEAFSSAGDVDSPNNVKVTVERFGNSREKDALFENYITKCDFRVQRAFRLPSIFLGFTDQFSFAALHAAYTVTESQVFAPERRDFDELVNLRLLPALDSTGEWLFASLPLNVRDVAQQLKAMEMVKEIVSPDTLIKEVNYSVDLSLDQRRDAPASDLEPGVEGDTSTRMPSSDRATPSQSARPGNTTPTAS